MGVKISNLPVIVTPAFTDIFPVVQSGVTYKETFTQLSSLFATAGDNSNITSITGLTTPLSVPQGGTGVTSFGTGVAAALGENVNEADGIAISIVSTFVPTLEFGGSSVGITYSDRRGHCVKVGRMVCFSIDFTLSSKGAQTGAATVSGLPYATLTNSTQTFSTSQADVTYTGVIISRLDGNDTSLTLQDLISSTGELDLNDTAFTGASVIRISGSYITDV
jgi:hypothetical protein